MNIAKNFNTFLNGNGRSKGRKPIERNSSFDYCFNYFQSFKEKNIIHKLNVSENMQNSCLQIGFYLASWGMLRGSSFLIQKSIKYYEPLIEFISQTENRLWDIDVNHYNHENISLLIDCKNKIRLALGAKNKATDTLVTKIMLGVFANVPAFDSFFKKGFSLYSCNTESLNKIRNFYNSHKETIDKYKIYTIDFNTGKATQRKYTKAKLIDMIGFSEGQSR